VDDIRRAFFNFFMEPLQNFVLYLRIQKSPTPKVDFESIFDLKEFLKRFEGTL